MSGGLIGCPIGFADTVSPAAIRSILGSPVGFTDVHPFHRCLERRFNSWFAFFFLWRISDGDSGSLEAFLSGDDDEGDEGIWVCRGSACIFAAGECRVDKGGCGEAVGSGEDLTDLCPHFHQESRFPTCESNA